ncbi:hypothetical protein Tco_0089776 [Tanacetum coccineum]
MYCSLHIHCLALFLLSRFGSLSHLKDAIVGGLKIQMLYQEQLVGRKSRSLTDLIVVTFLQRLEQESTTTSDIRPTKAEYESSWWIRSQLFFRQHVPKVPVVQHHSLYETYLAKLEKSRKRGHSSFRTSSGVLTTVLARERKNEYGFKDEFSRLSHELRLCLEAEERMRLEHEKNIIKEQSILGKLTHTKGNHVDSMPGKTKATISNDLLVDEGKNIKCKFHEIDDYTVGQNFWLTLVCLDPTQKGWLSEEHIVLWVDISWHGRPKMLIWAKVSLLCSDTSAKPAPPCIMPSVEKYSTTWSEWLIMYIFPINKTLTLVSLPHFDIFSGLSFYDSGDTYEYESHDLTTKVFEKKGIDPTDYSIRFKLADPVPKQGGIFGDCGYLGLYFLYRLAHDISLDVEDPIDVALAYREKINATSHLEHLNGMIEMLEGMHFTLEIYDNVWCLREMVKSENKKLLDLKKQLVDAKEDIKVKEKCLDILEEAIYSTLRKDWGVFWCGSPDVFISSVSAFTCDRDIFPSCLHWILSSIVENKWALFYCLPNKSLEKGLKLIHTDNDVHSFFADAERRGRMSMQTFLNELGEFPDLTPTKEREVDDEAVGGCYRRAIINGKAKMVEVADVGLVEDELNLLNKKDLGKKPVRSATDVQESNVKAGEYPIRYEHGMTLTLKLNASDEEVKSKVKSYENRKLDASAMSPHELVEWAEQEAGSPYLRTPSIKPRRKGIEFPCKNLFADFLHCDSVADEIVLHDNWKYEGLSLDGPIDVGGPTTWCDLVHECVVENGDSLPIMDKECFSNNVVLDDVVPANRKSTPLLLMKKGRNKVSFTRKSRCVKNSKTFSLRKGCGKRVACGANTRRLGGLMGLNVQTFRARKGWGKRVACGDNTRKLGGLMALNVHVVDEVSQVTKQGSMSAGSSQHRG